MLPHAEQCRFRIIATGSYRPFSVTPPPNPNDSSFLTNGHPECAASHSSNRSLSAGARLEPLASQLRNAVLVT